MNPIDPIRPVSPPPRPALRRRRERGDETPHEHGEPHDDRRGDEEPREDDGLPHIDVRA